jgi:hypothetical protein
MQKENLQENVLDLGNAARTIVNLARRYLDIVLIYAFFAARAVDIYCLKDKASNMRFDYGYIHPDREEDAYSKLDNNDPQTSNAIVDLIKDYVNSWSSLIEVSSLRDEFRKYFWNNDNISNFDRDIKFFKYNDPELLKQFRNTHEMRFTLKLKDFPESRSEIKVVSVKIGLIGTSASTPVISCILEHSGNWKAKRRNGDIIQIINKPRKASISAAKTMTQFDDLSLDESSFKDSFWGRGPITSWYLYIENQELVDSQVNLSSLTEIQIAIQYDAFLD